VRIGAKFLMKMSDPLTGMVLTAILYTTERQMEMRKRAMARKLTVPNMVARGIPLVMVVVVMVVCKRRGGGERG